MKEYKFKIAGLDYNTTVEDLNGGNFKVTVNGQTYDVEVPQKKASAPKVALPAANPSAQTGGPVNVASELPGTVTKINVSNGQHVKRGDVLLVIEAMKMENEVLAPQDGVVKQIATSKGAVVATGDLLIVI